MYEKLLPVTDREEQVSSVNPQVEPSGSAYAFHELVLRRIRLLSRRRITWLRKIWTEIASKENEQFNAHREVDGYLFDADIPSLEREWIEKDPFMTELTGSIRETECLLFTDQGSRTAILSRIFGLNRLETDVLHICLAISIDPNLGRVFAYMQDNSARGYITETLVARLFGYGQCLLLRADSPLRTWKLIKETDASPGEPGRMECDPFIRNWLLGMNEIDENLNNFSTLQSLKEPLVNWPVKKAAGFIRKMIHDDAQNRIRIFVSGAEGSGRRSFARIVCQQLGLSLLSVNTDRIPESSWPHVYMLAQRQAFLSNTALAWYGAGILDRFWPRNTSSYFLQFVIGETDGYIRPETGFADLRIEMPVNSFEERLVLWKQFVPQSADWPEAELEEMVRRHQSTIGEIVFIGQKMTAGITEAYEALRADSGRRLGSLAQQMNNDFTWNDLVVPEYVKKAIEDFTFEATERVSFWEQAEAKRLFPQGKSLIALFTGSPGTGKTMAAQVIAGSLKLELFRIDLSSVVSKYIGESSKNIERILSKASSMNVVLLFDEADSLFGKRTEIKDAHDRYANTDTNYLLQAIEEYPGIVILASNNKANIDTGFMRRLRYLIDFSKPDRVQRLQLWRRIVGELAGEKDAARLDNDLVRLAELLEITGAQIKLAILSALFMARRDKTGITVHHLLKGLERELIKEGRGLGRQIQQSFTY